MSGVATGTAQVRPTKPYGVHPDRKRGPLGRFLPRDLRDEMGRRLVPMDLREAERRLKARPRKEEE